MDSISDAESFPMKLLSDPLLASSMASQGSPGSRAPSLAWASSSVNAKVMHAHNLRMDQPGHSSSLSLKRGQKSSVNQALIHQELYGDLCSLVAKTEIRAKPPPFRRDSAGLRDKRDPRTSRSPAPTQPRAARPSHEGRTAWRKGSPR